MNKAGSINFHFLNGFTIWQNIQPHINHRHISFLAMNPNFSLARFLPYRTPLQSLSSNGYPLHKLKQLRPYCVLAPSWLHALLESVWNLWKGTESGWMLTI